MVTNKNESKTASRCFVAAWECNKGLLLGQIKAEEKSNEITAIPELLEMMDIKGSTITIDAAGCQKKIVK